MEGAYNVIKEAIINMEVKPGQPLPEERLVEQLGISRTPLRAALNRLSCEELVDIFPGKGTYVSKVSYEDMVDTLHVRLALERLAARQAVEKESKEYNQSIHQMEDILSHQGEWSHNPQMCESMFAFLQYDNQFHKTICGLSGNKVLQRQIMGLKDRFNRFVILSNSLQDRIPAVIIEHRLILEAIKERDAARAEEAMAAHILEVQQGIEEGMKTYLS